MRHMLADAEKRRRGSSELPGPILLAHELRSHLAAIMLASSHLRHLTASAADEDVTRALTTIDNAVGRATELTTWVTDSVADLLEPVSDGQSALPGVPRNSHVDLVKTVTDVVSDLRRIIPQQDVRVAVSDHVAALGDEVRIRAILTIVILNTARRSTNGTAIDVTVYREKATAQVVIASASWRPGQAEIDALLLPFSAMESTISLDLGSPPKRVATGSSASTGSVRAASIDGHVGVIVRMPLGRLAVPDVPRPSSPAL
ncbi:MAG: hypothetical protein ACJ735_12430 [Actinomycetes bacterium]